MKLEQPIRPSGGSGITEVSKSTDYTWTTADVATRTTHPSSDNNARTWTLNTDLGFSANASLLGANDANTLTIAKTGSGTLAIQPSGLTGNSFTVASGGRFAMTMESAGAWKLYGSSISPVNIPIDMIVDLGNQTAGTAVTVARMSSGSTAFTGWTITPDPTVGFTIENGSNRFISSFQLGATNYPAGGTTNKRLALVNSNAATYATGSIPSGHKTLTTAGFITLGAPAGDFDIYDLITIGGASTGSYAIIQLFNGNPYSINIETNPGGVTTHSDSITVSQGSTLWYSFHPNYTTGIGTIQLFSGATLVATVSFSMANTAEDAGFLRIGNAESGNGTGTNYFENWIVDFTNAIQPLGP